MYNIRSKLEITVRRWLFLAAALPVGALGGGYIIFVVWDRLIRSEIIPNATLAWFPTVALIWGCIWLVAAVSVTHLQARRPAPRSRRKAETRKAKSP